MKTLESRLTLLAFAALATMGCLSVRAAECVVGADLSSVTEYEAKGYTWIGKDGKKGDPMKIAKDFGVRAVRLRVWVDPKNGWCGLADTVAKAKRAKKLGLDVMVDFHYSDSWADPGKQPIPKAWRGKTAKEAGRLFYDHTTNVLEAVKATGANVRWVQVGNEIVGGLLWTPKPDAEGHTHWEEVRPGEWAAITEESLGNSVRNPKNFAAFFTAGARAAKRVFPEAQVIVHVTPACKLEALTEPLERLARYGATSWDVIGVSLYTNGERPKEIREDAARIPTVDHETLARAFRNIRTLSEKWHNPVMIVETGFETHPPKPLTADYSAERLREVMTAVRTDLADVCTGVFYWEPMCPDSTYSMGAFREEHWPDKVLTPTPIMKELH